MNQKAFELIQKGQIAKAMDLAKTALNKTEQNFGADHYLAAESLKNLALCHQAQGNIAETENSYNRALQIIKKTKGEKSIETAQLMNNMASFYYTQAKYDQALLLYQQTFSIVEKHLAPSDPILNAVKNNIAICQKITKTNAPDKPTIVSPDVSSTLSPLDNKMSVKDMVPEEIKKFTINKLSEQNILLSQFQPLQSVMITDKGVVFPYHCIQKNNTDEPGKDVVVLFAAVKNKEKTGAFIFQQTRIVSYKVYMGKLKEGGEATLAKEMTELFPELYLSN